MNRVIVIGNGFDKAHGLKTGYRDFFDNYWETVISKILVIISFGSLKILGLLVDRVPMTIVL